MDNIYLEKMKEWIDIDNVHLTLKQQTQELINKKKVLEEDILKYIEDNHYEKVVVSISDGTLKFPKHNIQQAISVKLLKSLLTRYNEEINNIDVASLIDYITSNLETKSKLSIKRDIR